MLFSRYQMLGVPDPRDIAADEARMSERTEGRATVSKENVIKVRNAIFESGDGMTLDEVMQGVIMAQAKLVASTVKGDTGAALAILEKYRAMQTEAMPIYCASERSADN